MKFTRFLIFLTILFILAGCSLNTDSLTTLLAFPDTEWNMSPEAFLSEFAIADSAIERDFSDYYAQYKTITVENLTVFDVPATATFRFIDISKSGSYGLHYIVVLFPDGTDMASIHNKLTAAYGSPIEFDPSERDAEYCAHVSRWESKQTFYDALSNEQLRSLDAKLLEEYKESSLAYIMWSDEAYRILTGNPDNWTFDPHAIVFYCGLAEIATAK